MAKRVLTQDVLFVFKYATHVFELTEITPIFVFGYITGKIYPAHGYTEPLTLQQVQRAMVSLCRQNYIYRLRANYTDCVYTVPWALSLRLE